MALESKSAVGKALFGQHLHEVATGRADEQRADDALFFVQNCKEITAAALGGAIQETVVVIAAMPGSDKIPDRRKVPK